MEDSADQPSTNVVTLRRIASARGGGGCDGYAARRYCRKEADDEPVTSSKFAARRFERAAGRWNGGRQSERRTCLVRLPFAFDWAVRPPERLRLVGTVGFP